VRLFVALELPGDVRETLVAWRTDVLGHGSRLREVKPEAARLREVKPEGLHVTLCFLGGRSTQEIAAIGAACETIASHTGMTLALGSAAWLPPRRPRVLAVKLEDPDHGLATLQADLSKALQTGGWYTPEARPFLPHVTLARVGREGAGRRSGEGGGRAREGGGRKARSRVWELTPPERMRFTGVAVTLFRSELGSGGARYEALRTVRLRGK
jgi:RNA 2',3'-cyclic 3'-phosphodiesterase